MIGMLSPATSITHTGGDWQVTTPDGTVTAPRVILAANGHLESFGFAKGRLMHLFLYASMTPELDPGTVGGASRWGITPSERSTKCFWGSYWVLLSAY